MTVCTVWNPTSMADQRWALTCHSSKISVWQPDTEQSVLRGNRQMLCVGHYVNEGSHDKPDSGGGGLFSSKKAGKEKMTIEAKDESKWGLGGTGDEHMQAVLNRILPHPVRFHEVWRQQRGSVLYAWEPGR